MSRITKFIMGNVRCFKDAQEFRIRPLTLLVGENSTGKTTALGCMQAFFSYFGSRAQRFSPRAKGLDFNVEPYEMGTFFDIVRQPEGEKGQFYLELEGQDPDTNSTVACRIDFAQSTGKAEPIVKKIQVKQDDFEITFDFKESARDRTMILEGLITQENKKFRKAFMEQIKSGKKRIAVPVSQHLSGMPLEDLSFVLEHALDEAIHSRVFLRKKVSKKNGKRPVDSVEMAIATLEAMAMLVPSSYSNILSFAPIRSKTQRTYNAIKEQPTPEGSEMPMTLLNLFMHDKEKWRSLKAKLKDFGKESGMFTDIEVKRYGKEPVAPFRINVAVRKSGVKVNLVDVGYGVSQVLPILTSVFRAESHHLFFMQQPEVHLHPRGQAALTSLLVNIHKNQHHSFIMETHSDYMIGRARIEIRKGNIKAEDVSLIYLEPKNAHVKVHNIEFDKMGNMLNVPDSYRDFFQHETDRLLGLED